MHSFLKDLGFAARTLRKNPAFALTAIITLALGIGVSTAIFSVVNAVLLRPLPYRDADRLTIITQDLRARGVVDFPLPPADVPDIRNGATLFDGIAAVQTGRGAPLGREGEPPEPITVAAATTNIFDVLKVPVVLGRNFIAADGTPQPVPPAPPGGPSAAAGPPPARLPTVGILGYGFWQRKYGGDPAVIGRSIVMFGQPVQVVGVASPGAELLFPASMQVERYPDLWIALRVNFEAGSRMNVAYRLIGRMKPGVSLGAARAQIERIGSDLRQQFPIRQTSGDYFRLEPMKAYLVAGVQPAILALMGAVIFVLLIACANVANLLLVRASQRERELAVRAALGGSAWIIVRQLLAESFLLSAIAAIGGIGLARLGIALLLHLAPASLPRLTDVTIDPMVLGFTVLASVAAAILFGLVPALRASRPDLAEVLRASGRTPSLGRVARLRSAVIIAEVALSFVLLVGSGLMIRSFVALTHVDPGYDPAGVLTFALGNVRARSPDEAAALARQVQARLGAIPGVTGVTAAATLPLDGSDASCRWGTPDAAGDPNHFRQASFFVVLPGYFETMKTRLLAGRTFTDADNVPSSHAIVIDDAMAKLAFGNAPAIGKALLARVRTDEPETFTVIGVVAHQRHTTLVGTEKEALYFPNALFGSRAASEWVVRTAGNPTVLGPAVRGAIAAMNPQLMITEMRPMTALVDQAQAATRFALVLISIFAGIAAVLAAVGLYGVLSSVVRQRTSEIGIRMALGARSSRIFRLVIGQGLALSGAGVMIGLVAAFAVTRLMASMLVGIRPTDPVTFLSMVAAFLLVATAACWLPARRAAALDPNAALREE